MDFKGYFSTGDGTRCEVLVSSKVVHDAAAVFAVDHVGVKTALFLRAESPHPTYGLVERRTEKSPFRRDPFLRFFGENCLTSDDATRAP